MALELCLFLILSVLCVASVVVSVCTVSSLRVSVMLCFRVCYVALLCDRLSCFSCPPGFLWFCASALCFCSLVFCLFVPCSCPSRFLLILLVARCLLQSLLAGCFLSSFLFRCAYVFLCVARCRPCCCYDCSRFNYRYRSRSR